MIRKLLMKKINTVIDAYTSREEASHENKKVTRKLESCRQRKAEILKVEAEGKIQFITPQNRDTRNVAYDVHYKYFIKQGNHFYLEEEVENRKCIYFNEAIYEDEEVLPIIPEEPEVKTDFIESQAIQDRGIYQYDRLKAIQYAEKWWNSYNPAYKKFENDCTNYISQCLHAGDAPMRGYPSQGKGWWMRNNSWSYSWTVANSLRWYIPSSSIGLRGKVVEYPEQLKLGDVICYDFQGDGRFDHTTIVTGKDGLGMPLVNAHTFNSRMRYWNYEDSTAYTPNIKYKFFTIIDDS
ncbi:amidase domain-containing protein [Rossellomorea aquimaris]|uniref:amidase domain-containing protein n=1 Tax=Rossellomorea aquimaris TaxID=189382 RepID=UPI0007D05E1B|nr:amidase domain-containing protein [Rossellomorea aquimaris]